MISSPFFKARDPACVNHCVSLYPSEDHHLQLDQIDYLRNRYPANVIGFSTHEYHDWSNSMMISYGKGARSWERTSTLTGKTKNLPSIIQSQNRSTLGSKHFTKLTKCVEESRISDARLHKMRPNT